MIRSYFLLICQLSKVEEINFTAIYKVRSIKCKTATDRQVCKAIRASWICPSKGFLKWFVHKGYFFLSILKIFIFDYRPTLKSKEVTLQILYHYVSPNIIIFLLVVIIPEVVAHFWSSQGCMQKREKDLDQIQLMQCWMLMHCNGHHDLCIQKVWSITTSFVICVNIFLPIA